jgi:Ice-binding-like
VTRRRRGEGHHPIDAWAAALPQLSQAAAVFIFQIGSTLTTASSSSVVLINGAQACNVFWRVGSSATLGTGTTLVGNIIALHEHHPDDRRELVRESPRAKWGGDAGYHHGQRHRVFQRRWRWPAWRLPSRPRFGPFPIGVLPPLPVGGSVAAGFTMGGPIITDGLLVSATSSDTDAPCRRVRW